MKTYRNIIYIVLCSLFLVACSDDHYLRIDSLSTAGNEFYCNQKVKLWMCVESSDLWDTDYFWECDGGELTQPQGLDEMTWKAPNVPGTYKVRCTVTVGGKKEVREHEMYVSHYYFERFENADTRSFTNTSACTQRLVKEADGNNYWEVYVSNANNITGSVSRTFGDEDLCISPQNPFSTRMKMGFIRDMPTQRRINIGSSYANNTIEWRWTCQSHPSLTNQKYVTSIRVTWFPMQLSLSGNYDFYLPDDPSTWGSSDPYPVNEGVLEKEGNPENCYNVAILVEYRDETGQTRSKTEYRLLNTLNNFKNGEYRILSMGIDENLGICFYNEGQLALQSNLLRDYQTEIGFAKNIYINSWGIYLMNGNGGRNMPVYYFDDAYASNTELLK